MANKTYSMFGRQLVERKLITEEQLDEAIRKQQTTMKHRKLGEILVRLGYISKSHIADALSQQLDIPIVSLNEMEIPERVRSLVDGNIATLYRIVPIEEDGNALVVATADPTNVNNLDNLSRLLDRPIMPRLTTPEEISRALARYYGLTENTVETMLSTVSSASTMSTLSTMSSMSSLSSASSGSLDSLSASEISMSSVSMDALDFDGDVPGLQSDVDDEDGDSPVVRYVHNIILEAFRLRASDIHVEPGKFDVKVRYRIDGVLHQMPTPPKRAQAAIISRLKLMAGMDISERRVPQDGRIKLNIAGKMVDLRVSALPAVHGESIVMRILDKSGLMLGLGQLGFSERDQKTWQRLLEVATGVVLVTGPTGSGKTTTLYASLHNLNKPDVKLITVEDPVEYQLNGINQVQINHDIGWDFSRALRSIFRQDPDTVMVGEIRDLETAEIAIKAALTGHLVFSTLHTNDTSSSFIRLVDIGLKPFLVASGVRAILAQRLLRTICTACKQPMTPDPKELVRLCLKVESEGLQLFHGEGCENCNHTGFQGRIGAYELLLTSDTIRTMLMQSAPADALRMQARREGMISMREDAWQKALNGITTIEEVNKRTRADPVLLAEIAA
ncbi:MAG TPA: ATPase, T2SS/T4P/T4SS family [Candidatus Hydrogenedentes bacterium]|nr:ATPase, T2SS/T4P/T4SS family [Candidatus Hydrogenedentota bacterium]HPG68679.1 ATPase, T2SS/T4P/T4SS family [Candidatus Hydrogenedentota bacterium]